MAKPEGLAKRGTRFFIRVRVPDRLRPILGKREIIKALGTSDRAEALVRLHRARVEIDGLFRTAQRKLIALPASAPEAPEPAPDAILGAMKGWLAEQEREMLARPLPRGSDAEAWLENLRTDIAMLGRPSAAEDPAVQLGARGIIEKLGYHLELGGPAFWQAAELLARASAELASRTAERVSGMSEPHDALFAEISPASASAKPRPITFGELVERYIANPSRKASPKTRAANKATHKVLLDILGSSTPLAAIDREACRRAQGIVQRLPANFMKMTPRRTAERAAEHADKHGLPKIATATANTYLGGLAALFRWAEAEGLTDRNPARGLMAAGDAGSIHRRPFALAELRIMFAAAPYPVGPRDAWFWLPLLGLFTGARLGELAQLDTSDVAQRDGVLVLLIREDAGTNKRLKTKNAARIIPVHPELLKIGFGQHVTDARQRGAGRIFPELRPAASGYISDLASKKFGRWLRKLGITDRAVSFHSFRHSFRDGLREAGVPQEMALALGGWSRGENAAAGYGSGFRPSSLAEALARVSYPGLDLQPLHLSSESKEGLAVQAR